MVVNFTKGTGRLTTDRYDFEKHINGSDFRHKANQIDINNPSIVYNNPSTVEQALEYLNNFVISQETAGIGFVAVPDGYDTYHAQNGTINFDNTIPSLDTFLNPLFTAIVNDTALPTGFERIRHGGVIFIKAGTYIIKNTITVPPGIILMGEAYGTKIVNVTSLDTTVLPPVPKVSPTTAPLFTILADGYRSSNDAAIDPNMFVFQRTTKFINLIISDNFIEPTILGDTYYKLPQNKTSATSLNPPSLISQQLGSNLYLENVILTGRANFSSGLIVSQVTGSAITIDNSTVDTETFCKINNCFIDGFSIPFDLSNSINSQDYLEIKNSKIRCYGYFNGNNSIDGYNCFIKAHTQNISVNDCILYGNASNITSLLHLTNPGTTPNLQGRSKLVISNNQVSIEKSNNLTNSTWKPIYFESSFSVDPANFLSSVIFGNSFQDTFDIYVDSGNGFTAPGIGSPNISIAGTSVSVNTNTFFAVNGPCDLNGSVNITKVATIQGSASGLTIESGANLIIDQTAISNITSGSNSTIIMKNGSTFDGYAGSFLNLDGYVTFNTYTTSVNYTCDTSSTNASDFLIAVDTSVGATNITLPLATNANKGRILIIKDYNGNAGANHITVSPQSGQFIDVNPGYIISTAYGSLMIISLGTRWAIINTM